MGRFDDAALDPELLRWATPKQREALEKVVAHGGTVQAAERALGLANDVLGSPIRRLRRLAASKGYAPGHFTDGTAPGYSLGKVTIQRIQRDEEGRLLGQTWERHHPEQQRIEDLVARFETRLDGFPRFPPVALPEPGNASLLNFLGLFDLHIGEKISCADPAGRWDIATAKRTIMASVRHAIHSAPSAKRMILCFGGDAMHYDGLLPVTPKSRHVLHSDGDFDDMVDAVLDVLTYSIDHALQTHEEVDLIWAEGNHDEASSLIIRKMIARLYADEPRLTVAQSKAPYYALQFGKVMVGVHHGHKAKLTRYAGIFANMFREMWGATKYAYGHRGHEHHIHEKEGDGMIATQHPSLAPSDDYALGMGLISRRGCMMVTYHAEFGEVSRNTTRPEMLGVFDEALPLAA